MPVADDIHPELVLRFIFQQLSANSAWVAIHGDRLYEDVRVSSKPAEPFAIAQSREVEIVQFAGTPEYIGKIRSWARVVSVRTYSNGRGEWFDFTASYRAMRDALTGITAAEVTLGSTKIGEIYSSSYLRVFRDVHKEGDYEVLSHGIEIDVIHK